MYKDSYQRLGELEDKLGKVRDGFTELRLEVEELINELEVEEFLEEGPGGKEPT